MTPIEVFYKIFLGSEFEGCVLSDHGEAWLRWDIDDCDPKEQSAEYYFLMDRLKDFGTTITEAQIEHDCISGTLAIISEK